jgi:cell division protease FtsH
MAGFPWFPLGYEIPGCSVGPLRREGVGYQIVVARGSDRIALVIDRTSFVGRSAQKLAATRGFGSFEFAGKSYFARVFDKDEQPIAIEDWPKLMSLPTSSEVSGLSQAIERLLQESIKADVGRALFLPAFDECLAVAETEQPQDLRKLAQDVLTAGAPLPELTVASIRAINSWVLQEDVERFLDVLGVRDVRMDIAPTVKVNPASFSLPGRPKLEQFFREYVLDPSANPERYAALGVQMPNGVLLYGPPGSGKSHAIRKLKAVLGWTIKEINLGKIGSPYIHQTSIALERIFNEAKLEAPAIIVLEEVDAMAAARGGGLDSHKTEEVAQLLQLIEVAAENRILVVGTTNRKDALDPAFTRKGRLDHMIEVGYPTGDEVRQAIEAMLENRPHTELPNIDQLARRLANRPMSDVAWVINEAARLAARGQKDALDELDLFSALDRLRSA